MIIQTKGKFLVRTHFWFEKDIQDLLKINRKSYKCDELIIHGNQSKLESKNISCIKQESLVTNLSKGNDELWSMLTKTVRNEINRAEREGVVCKYYKADEIFNSSQLLIKFANMYHDMYMEKGISSQFLSISELKDYAKKGNLLISTAIINEETVVFHSYIYNNDNSRLLHSCSEFRVKNNANKNAIGRANKFLHWNDMMEFQKLGVKKYDWGGISSIDNPNGIDKFKMAFGGLPVEYYNIILNRSIRLKLWRKCYKLVKRAIG